MKKVNIYVSELGEDFLTKDREEFEKQLPISDPVPVEKKEEITQSTLNKRLSRIQNSIKTTTDKANEIIEISEEVEEKIGKDYSRNYFTTVVTTGGNILWDGKSNNALSYSTDGGTTWSTASSSITLSVNDGDKVLWKGVTTPVEYGGIGKFGGGSTSVRYSVEGNVMSLLFGDDFKGQTSLEGKNYAFSSLFFQANNYNVTSIENLSLPATTLSNYCYSGMFQGCTSLTTAPQLPAITLTQNCYSGMFADCTKLTNAPQLPATILASNCYDNMFSGCTSLTSAPELPATTLATWCYYGMFSGCTSLTTAPELPATTLAMKCYRNMFQGCTSLTNAPELPAITLVYECYRNMFDGCTKLTNAPELPAITLVDSCYRSMFDGCTNLKSIKCLATDISAYNCTKEWVNGVATNGTFAKDENMTNWTTGVNGIPEGWTVQNA